jgi:hypothetical protein
MQLLYHFMIPFVAMHYLYKFKNKRAVELTALSRLQIIFI